MKKAREDMGLRKVDDHNVDGNGHLDWWPGGRRGRCVADMKRQLFYRRLEPSDRDPVPVDRAVHRGERSPVA